MTSLLIFFSTVDSLAIETRGLNVEYWEGLPIRHAHLDHVVRNGPGPPASDACRIYTKAPLANILQYRCIESLGLVAICADAHLFIRNDRHLHESSHCGAEVCKYFRMAVD